jgi:hypothetical protein
VAVLLVAGCVGPNLISTREDENGVKSGIVSFHGRENIGYVDARVMQERTDDALEMARTFCDGGVEVTEKRSEGGENFIDFKCTVAMAAASAAIAHPCPDVPPAAATTATDAQPPASSPAPAVSPATDAASEPAAEPPPPAKKKKKKSF